MYYIDVYIHDGRSHQIPISIPKSKIVKYLSQWKRSHYRIAKHLQADNYIYCSQTLNQKGVLERVDLLSVGISNKVVATKKSSMYKKKDKTIYICAWVKGKDY